MDSVPGSIYSEPDRSRALRMPRSCGLLCRPACTTAGAGRGLSLSLDGSNLPSFAPGLFWALCTPPPLPPLPAPCRLPRPAVWLSCLAARRLWCRPRRCPTQAQAMHTGMDAAAHPDGPARASTPCELGQPACMTRLLQGGSVLATQADAQAVMLQRNPNMPPAV